MKSEQQDYLVVGIALIGAACGALSLVLQKQAHKNIEASNKSAYCTFTWLFGFFLFGCSQLFYLGALPFADLVIFSTTGAVNLISNACFSALILGERFTRYDLLATILILSGTTGIILQTHKGSGTFTRDSITALMTQATQSVILVAFYVYMGFVKWFDQYVEKRIDKFYQDAYLESTRYGRNHRLSTTLNESAFLDMSMSSVQETEQIKKYQPSYNQLIHFIQTQPKDVLREISPSFGHLSTFIKMPMLCMALLCGMTAAVNGVFFKLAGELIKSNNTDYNAFTDWLFYLFISLGVFNCVAQVPFLQIMMSKYNQMESMPIFYGSMILFEIFAGLYLLDEYAYYTKMEVFGIYLLGMVCVCGIQVIMKKPVQNNTNTSSGQEKPVCGGKGVNGDNIQVSQVLFDKENQIKESLIDKKTTSDSSDKPGLETRVPSDTDDEGYGGEMSKTKEKILLKLRSMRQVQKEGILLANLENSMQSNIE